MRSLNVWKVEILWKISGPKWMLFKLKVLPSEELSAIIPF